MLLNVKQLLQCSTCGTRCVARSRTNSKISLTYWVTFWKKADRIVVTTFETYPVLTTERLFYNGQFTPDGARKVYEGVILCLPLRTVSLIIHLWTATLYHENHGTSPGIPMKTVMLYMKPVNVEMIHICINRLEGLIQLLSI